LGALQTTLLNTADDAFLAKLNPAGGGKSDLLYATYYGGSGDGTNPDQGFGIAIDSANPPNAYIAGETFSTDLPVVSAFQSKLNGNGAAAAGNSDAFVAKLALVPTLTVAPSPFNFGPQPVGVATNAQQFTVTNNTANTATFSSIVTTGVSPLANTDFAVSNDACSPAGVGAGLTCTVSVKFTPSVAAAESATLVITATVTNGGQNSTIVLKVNLSGTGSASAPGVGLAPANLSFGGQMLTTTSAATPVTLTNTGNGALTINTIAGSGDFAATSTGAGACPIGPATLLAGAKCTINVTFAPTVLGARVGTLTVTDNAGGSPHTVPLTGSGWDFGLAGPAQPPPPITSKAPGNFNVTMTPLGGFNQNVGLTCAVTPAAALSTCTVTTPVMAADGVTAQNAAVMVTTTALMVPPPSVPVPPASIRQIVPVILAFLLLMLLPKTNRVRLRLAMAAAMFAFIFFAACNGIKHVTNPIPATVTVTGTSTGTAGSVVHKAIVSVTIN